MSSPQVVKIDDRDPSITYSSGWEQGGAGTEYMNTVTLTVQVKATAKISFTGTKIMVYGTIPSTAWGIAPTSIFTVDGGPETQFVEPQIDTSSQYQQQFYASPDLSPGNHVLYIVITSVPNATASFEIDFVEYYPISNSGIVASSSPISSTITPSVSGPSQTSTSGTSMAFTASASNANGHTSVSGSALVTSLDGTGSFTSTSSTSYVTGGPGASNPSSNNPQATGASSKSSTPAILGAVIGVLALVLVGIGIFFLLRKRKSIRGEIPIDGDKDSGLPPHNPPRTRNASAVNTTVTPFIPSQVNTSTASEHFSTNSWEPSQALSPFNKPSTPLAAASSSFNAFSPPTNSNYSKAAEAHQTGGRIEEGELYDYPPPRYES